jgi:hypothetical protein
MKPKETCVLLVFSSIILALFLDSWFPYTEVPEAKTAKALLGWEVAQKS